VQSGPSVRGSRPLAWVRKLRTGQVLLKYIGPSYLLTSLPGVYGETLP
jgi:hypothetical protein